MTNNEKLNPMLPQKHFIARKLRTSFLLQPLVGLWFLGIAAYGIWDGLSNFATRGAWSALYLAIAAVGCWIGTKILVIYSLRQSLIRHWQANHFGLVAAICSRAISILGRSPLVGGLELAILENQFGLARMYQGSFESAESLFNSAIDRVTKAAEHAPERNGCAFIPSYALMVHNLAVACCRQDNHAEAIAKAKTGLELVQNTEDKRYEIYRALLLLSLGTTHLRLNQLDVAEEY